MKKIQLLTGLLLIALLLASQTGCSGPGYYFQAVSGQLKLMHAREDIHSLLENPETRPELAGQLTLANQLLAFASDQLDLPSDGSYTSYVKVEGEALVWNVVATEAFSLEPRTWCFPVAGCVPYRGFFKQKKALDSAERLRNKGLDVYVSPAAAYSSLGWFRDPLLSTMLSGSEMRLAAYLFHELAHQRLYVKGDGKFNEAYASFVEQMGLTTWLENNRMHAELQQWQQMQNAATDFRALIKDIRRQLTDLFLMNLTDAEKRQRKAKIFNTIPVQLDTLRAEKWQGKRYYANWSEGPYNNARLALFSTYEGGHCAFERLWVEANGDARTFHQLAKQKSRLQGDTRSEWLNQSC